MSWMLRDGVEKRRAGQGERSSRGEFRETTIHRYDLDAGNGGPEVAKHTPGPEYLPPKIGFSDRAGERVRTAISIFFALEMSTP